ncbi:phage major capsid protein [Aerococcus urinaeequi]|uniref:phage major capsid protein n=1 Tax=Aerococcus urinaeequi TaxID=51665 RepID=UPI003B4CE1AD
MNFETTQEAFNYWNGKTIEEIETRASEIKLMVETDPEADISVLSVEVDGLKQAKENKEAKVDEQEERSRLSSILNFNPITGTSANKGEKETMNENVIATPEYRSAFLKTMLGRELNKDEQRAMNQMQMEQRAANTSSDVGAVLPTETLNEVIRKARDEGGLLAEARSFNMPANIALPIGNALSKAEWHTEGTTVEGEQAQLTSVKFENNELVKVFSISNKVAKTSISAFEQYITDELVASIMEALGQSLASGNGTAGQGQGLGGVTITNTATLSATPKYTEFTAAIAQLKRGYAKGAKFAMNNATLFNKVYGVVDNNNRPIFIQDAQNEAVGKILGYPVVIDDFIEDDVIYFGNFSQHLGYNLVDGISLEKSTESSFKQNLVDYKASAVADTKVILPEAFVKLSVPQG